MMDLIQFLKTKDPRPPDFIGKMADEGLCKPSCRQYPGSMDEQEMLVLKQRQSKYYKKEAIRLLLEIVPFEKP